MTNNDNRRPMRVDVSPVRVDDPTFLSVPSSLAERVRPVISPETEPYWAGLAQGEVVLDRCGDCDRWTHFPVRACMWCGSPAVTPQPVNGTGKVATFTACYLQYGPGLVPPYVAAMVELDCQPGLLMVTNLVGCRIDEVRIGVAVQPRIVRDGDLVLLFFEPRRL